MDLLVVGAGPVGLALARGWSAAGHTVSVAVRDPAAGKHDPYRGELRLVAVRALPTADVTVLAIPGEQLPALLDTSGRRLDGRLLVDATNTVGRPRLHQLLLLHQRLPAARVYRAFTTTGWENVTPIVGGERPDLCYAGPDSADRQAVEQLIADLGPRPVRLGDGPAAADLLDAQARLWFALAMRRGLGRHLAMRLLTGPAEPPPSTTATTARTVTIVGKGHVGTALGDAWERAGHRVTYAVRNPAGGMAPAASPVTVLAVPGQAVAALLNDHREALRGKLVVDATNIVGGSSAANAAATAAIPGARYARAFNTLGVENLRSPRFAGVPADMVFTASPEDRSTVAELVTAAGLRPVWLPQGCEQVVDDLLPLWLALAGTHGRHLAWRVLTSDPEL